MKEGIWYTRYLGKYLFYLAMPLKKNLFNRSYYVLHSSGRKNNMQRYKQWLCHWCWFWLLYWKCLRIFFMKKNCQKSCGVFKSAPKKCEDKQSLAYWYQIKRLNYCTNAKYKAHFQKYCPATCEFCKCKCRYICWTGLYIYRYPCHLKG